MPIDFKIKVAAGACALTAAAASASPDAAGLMGYVDGADLADVPVAQGRIDAVSGIVYNQIKSLRAVRQLKMSVMVPRTRSKKPAVIYFPGGGFTSSDHEKFLEMRYALARAGFVVAACEYRTVPDKFPALLNDAKAAVRFLRAHAADYGIDPERIGVLGDSAGGYLVQMMGATNGEKEWDRGDFLQENSDVQAVVSFYGISDLRSIGEGLGQDKIHSSPAVTEALLVHGPAFKEFAGASILSDDAKAIGASPIGHVDGSEPPFLLLHGSADKVVGPLQSAHMYEALKAAKSDVEYVLVRGAGHGDLPWYQPAVIARVVNFFSTKLGMRKTVSEDASNNL